MSSSFLQDVPAATLTQDTIRRLYQLIDQAKTDAKFQDLVYKITGDLRGKDYKGELLRILQWAKKNIRYTRDPYAVELVQDVWSTLSRERADCDDFDVLVGAMAEVMGAPVELVTVSTRADKEPVHTYPSAYVGGKWYALDATVPQSYPGWEPGRITDKIVWARSDVGLAGYDVDHVEGIGMFKPSVRQVNLTPGVPNDISHTYADMMPGTPVVSRRPQPGVPRAGVARYADLSESPQPGNIPFGPNMKIRPFPMPKEIWSHVPRSSVPIVVNAWPHDVKPWKKDWDAMLPETHVPEDKDMVNLGSYATRRMGGLGLGAITAPQADALVSAVAADTKAKVASGAVAPADAAAHAQNVIDAVTTGDVSTVSKNPKTSKTLMAIVKQTPNKEVCGLWSDPSLNWMPRPDGRIWGNGLGEYAHMSLGDLGPDEQAYLCDAINQDVTQQVAQGSIPPAAAPAAAAKVVDALKTGDSNVLQSTPATAAAARNIMSRKGGGRSVSTPATHPSHPTTSHTSRKNEMRDSSAAYWERDESTDFLPQMYGLSGSHTNRTALYNKVHHLVKQRLPKAIRAAGLHPNHVKALFQGKKGQRGYVYGLGQVTATVDPSTTSTAAQVITNAIPGVSPTDATAVSQAVTAGINAIVGASAPTAPGFSFNLAGWGVPLMVGAAILGVAMYMKKSKKKIRYQSNGSRRQSRRRGSRGKGGGLGKYVPWLLAGGAAYMIFKPSPVTATGAQAPGILSTIANLFKPSTSGGVSTPSPLTNAIASLFGGGAKAATSTPAATPSTPSPSGATDSSGMVTTDAQIGVPQNAPSSDASSSDFTTSLDA